MEVRWFGVPGQCEATFLGPLLIVFSKGGGGALNVTWMCWVRGQGEVTFLDPLLILCKQEVLEGWIKCNFAVLGYAGAWWIRI